jgi:hypothetical protein
MIQCTRTSDLGNIGEVRGTNIADAGKAAHKARLLENGRAAGDIGTWCWNGATPDAMARPALGYAFCCTTTMLDFDTPIRLLRNSQSTTALRRQKIVTWLADDPLALPDCKEKGYGLNSQTRRTEHSISVSE